MKALLDARSRRPDVRDLVRRLPARAGPALNVGCTSEHVPAAAVPTLDVESICREAGNGGGAAWSRRGRMQCGNERSVASTIIVRKWVVSGANGQGRFPDKFAPLGDPAMRSPIHSKRGLRSLTMTGTFDFTARRKRAR